jgi:hypothetical protein
MNKSQSQALHWASGLMLGLAALNAAHAQEACDRECLKSAADGYVAAMVAHDARKAPLAGNLVLVENLERSDTNSGLWSSISAGPGEFRIYVPDVKAQQIGYIGVMQANGKPAMLGLRLKMTGNKVSEAEHVVAYTLRENVLQNLLKPRQAFHASVPEPYRDSRGRLLKIAADYYDALDENNGSLAPFADDCVRFENGIQTARNPVPFDAGSSLMGSAGLGCAAQLDTQTFQYITRIENRRIWIADEETGLAFGLSHFRHAMDRKEYPVFGIPGSETRKMDFKPFDLPAVHVFKIWGGQIHEIEALGYTTEYNSKTGWE